MKRFLAAAALVLALTGCKSVEPEEAWTAGWAVVATPVLLACTPYNLLWDLGLSLKDPGFLEHGMTLPTWRYWSKAVRCKEEDWDIPLAILLHPVLTILQPLPDILYATVQSRMGG